MTSTPSTLDVVAIGNAIVDVLVQSQDDFLSTHGLSKGTMALVDQEQAERLYGAMGPGVETSGGSAANTLAAIAQLGGKAGFIGRVRNDQLGAIFAHDLRATGALFDTPAAEDGPSTARCMILVSPDAERTMCTYLGASVNLDPRDVDLAMVRRAKVLYLEGYLWDAEPAKRAFLAASEEVRSHGGEVALSLSDPFCVDRHRTASWSWSVTTSIFFSLTRRRSPASIKPAVLKKRPLRFGSTAVWPASPEVTRAPVFWRVRPPTSSSHSSWAIWLIQPAPATAMPLVSFTATHRD